MTLMLAHIDSHGIVLAADSNLTAGGGTAAGTAQKVFVVPFLNAGLSLAGSYSVNGVGMDTWMPNAIASYGSNSGPTMHGLAEYLRSELERQMTAREKGSLCLVHLAGCVYEAGAAHVEFHFIRNFTGLDRNTGDYLGASSSFTTSEDFWSRDCDTPEKRSALAAGERWQIYINGFPPGRIAYLGLNEQLQRFLEDVWRNPNWGFRRPNTIDEVELLLKLQLNAISTFFLVSDYTAPFIGGAPQTLKITREAGEDPPMLPTSTLFGSEN